MYYMSLISFSATVLTRALIFERDKHVSKDHPFFQFIHPIHTNLNIIPVYCFLFSVFYFPSLPSYIFERLSLSGDNGGNMLFNYFLLYLSPRFTFVK